jgi:alkaline phosphatase D
LYQQGGVAYTGPVRAAAGGVLLGLVPVLVFALPAGAKVRGFQYGVTAGEVAHDSARVWGAAEGSGKVRAIVATDRRFGHVVKRRRLRAKSSNDNTIQARLKGLDANRRHFYRFCAKGASCGPKGEFRTAPRPNQSKTIRFAYSGDTDGTPAPGQTQPFWGTFEAFRAMRAENNHFNIHFGDTIYSDSRVAGEPPALTVEEKWRKYKQNLEQKNLTRLRRSAGFYSHWDDHEFINDFSIPEDGRRIYEAGVEAFRDYAPVTYSERRGIYRTFRWGRNLELFFLDELSFRSAKASAGETCNNPATNAPDLAPTGPQPVRNVFAALAPSLAIPVSEACRNEINDPNRTMLGEDQFDRFINAIDDSTARWKIVVNEKPIQQFYALPYDRWEGYAFERIRLLNELEQRGVGNVVFITTDTHAAFLNIIRKRTLDGDVAPSNAPPGPTDTPYQDFIIGPVATEPQWDEIDDVTGSPGSGRLLSQAFLKPEPPAGVGMECSQGEAFSYAEVTVSDQRVGIEYKTQDGGTVQDVNGGPCGPYTIMPFAP